MQMKLADDIVNQQGQVIARVFTVLEGDGSTPVVTTMGQTEIVGYSDQGEPIIPEADEGLIKEAQKNFMAKAIQTQKFLSEQNGINPDVVNMIGAENNG